MPTKKKTKTRSKAPKKTPGLPDFKHFEEDFKKDAVCMKFEMDDDLETLRFLKSVKLDPKIKDYTPTDTEKLIDEYREKDALAFARTIKKLLASPDKNFRDMLLENAEARLREHKNRAR